MADLSHWDFAEHFCGYDAAALILGLEPRESNDEQHRIRIITERMELHYKYALERIFHENFVDPFEIVAATEDNRIELISVKLKDLNHRNIVFDEETTLSDWLADRRQPKFENQEFERNAIAGWLRAIGMKSVYPFDRSNNSITPTTTVQSDTDMEDIDPLDLPLELDAANVAYRVVLNGYGNQSDTFKSRLIDYLQTNYKDLKPEAVQRIATVANPDKTAGRKKRDKE